MSANSRRHPSSATRNNASSGNGQEPRGQRAGVYVDTENLRADAQTIVTGLLDNWPVDEATPALLRLYVKADLGEIWRIWGESRFPETQVAVRGVQHFSTHPSKNSADIALAIDAITDFLQGRIGFIVVVSDDSDFIALFSALRDLTVPEHPTGEGHRVPFLWVVTQREGTLSAHVKQYFPNEYLCALALDSGEGGPLRDKRGSRRPSPSRPPAKASIQASYEQMAVDIIKNIPEGSFRSGQCQEIIKKVYPDHPLARAHESAFGTQFKNSLWPILEQHGARIPNPKRKPIVYEMTRQAKQSVGA